MPMAVLVTLSPKPYIGGCPIFPFPKAALSPPFRGPIAGFRSQHFLKMCSKTLSKSYLQVLYLIDLLNAWESGGALYGQGPACIILHLVNGPNSTHSLNTLPKLETQ